MTSQPRNLDTCRTGTCLLFSGPYCAVPFLYRHSTLAQHRPSPHTDYSNTLYSEFKTLSITMAPCTGPREWPKPPDGSSSGIYRRCHILSCGAIHRWGVNNCRWCSHEMRGCGECQLKRWYASMESWSVETAATLYVLPLIAFTILMFTAQTGCSAQS
jgi:hypothetical protein